MKGLTLYPGTPLSSEPGEAPAPAAERLCSEAASAAVSGYHHMKCAFVRRVSGCLYDVPVASGSAPMQFKNHFKWLVIRIVGPAPFAVWAEPAWSPRGDWLNKLLL